MTFSDELALRHRFLGQPAQVTSDVLAQELLALGAISQGVAGDLAAQLDGVSLAEPMPLSHAGEGSVCFASTPKYLAGLSSLPRPALLVVPAKEAAGIEQLYARHEIAAPVLLPTPFFEFCYGSIVQAFYPSRSSTFAGPDWDQGEPKPHWPQSCRVAPTAVVHATAQLGEGVQVGPGAVVSAHARLGQGVHLGPNSMVGPNVQIGEHTWIGHNVSLFRAQVGAHCNLRSGCVVGERGYGVTLRPSAQSPGEGELQGYEIPQIGGVRLGDRVELSANCTVDRGALMDTVLGDDTHMDNFAQIGHGARVGKRCSIGAYSALGGSAVVGDDCIIWSRSSIMQGLTLGAGSTLFAHSGMMKDYQEPKQLLSGNPAIPAMQHGRQVAYLAKATMKKPAKG